MRRIIRLLLLVSMLGANFDSLILANGLQSARAADSEDNIWLNTYQPRLYQVKSRAGHSPCKKPLTADEKARFLNKKEKIKGLCRAQLQWKNLQNRDLRGVILNRASLNGASLSGSDLTGADLRGAILGGTNLIGAKLEDADLRGAVFYHPHPGRTRIKRTIFAKADMSGVNLQLFDLENVDFRGANLRSSWLAGAKIRNSNLSKTNLSEAVLYKARLDGSDLSFSNLRNADLRGATMVRTDIKGAFFQPKYIDVRAILGARGLSSVRFENPRILVNLKKELREAGMRREERAVISALRKYQLGLSSRLDQWFNRFVLGGAITDFGANPLQPIEALFFFIIFFALVYLVGFSFAVDKTKVWKVWPNGHLNGGSYSQKAKSQPLCFHSLFKTSMFCLQFSLLSAFHIGWRELNVGGWLSRIQMHEYTYRAAGWIRTVAGIQSLLSVYLLALSALTYFGRPFE